MNRGGKSKVILYIILVVVLFAVIGGAMFLAQKFGGSDSGGTEIGTGNSGPPLVFSKATEEDFDEFERIIAQNAMIQDLPGSGVLQLSFYNMDRGEIEWEKYYTLEKESVAEGIPTDPDMNLVMHSKYLTALTENNFCRIVKTAKNNGDFYAEIHISTSSLLWKYKGMMEYKDCLGL